MKEYTKEEQLKIFEGISADGKISDEAKEMILAAIAEVKSEELLIGEVKRQLRCKLPGDKGVVVAAAVAELW